MKKKIITILTLIILAFTLNSCNLNFTDPNITIDKIYDENTMTSVIQTNITKTVEKVSNGCVGILAQNATSRSIGSGVIYKEVLNHKDNKVVSITYYVVTNEHVISKSTDLKIYLGNEVYLKCDKVGSDSVNDLAVLKFTVEPNTYNLVVNEISDEVRIPSLGGYCIAIGCPISLDNFNFVSVGNLSKCTYSQIVHTAAINPGNSGGALFDIDGQLLGINVSKLFYIEEEINGIVTKLPVDGLGNAIPSWVVKKVCADIEQNSPTLKRTTLGVTAANINASLDESMADKLPNFVNSGIYVTSVLENSNAALLSGSDNKGIEYTGIIPGDIISGAYVKNQFKKFDRIEYLKTYISTLIVGNNVKLEVYRKVNGEWKIITFSGSLR